MSIAKEAINALIEKQCLVVAQLEKEDGEDMNRFASYRWAQGRLAGLRSCIQVLSEVESELPSGGALDVNCPHCKRLGSSIEVECPACGTAFAA